MNLTLLFLAACAEEDSSKDTEETGYPYVDTDPDDSDTGETDETDTGETDTGETDTEETDTDRPPHTDETDTDRPPHTDETDTAIDTVDTGETADTEETGDTGEPTGLEDLAVSPASLSLAVGGSIDLRVVATAWSGEVSDSATAIFTSLDPAIATVDAAGLVTGVAAGSTTIDVTDEGLTVSAAVTVRDDGYASVTVLDASTGLPLEGATIHLDGESPVFSDASGMAELPVSDTGPVKVTVYLDETYTATTLVDTSSRSFVVPLTPIADIRGFDAEVGGDVDFGSVPDPGWTQLAMGLACASVQTQLAMLDLTNLFAEDRTVTVFGIDVEAPANLFLEGYEETYAAMAMGGPVAVWSIAGPVEISDATSGFSDSSEALALLVDSLPDWVWGVEVGETAVSDSSTTIDIAPDTTLDDTVLVPAPSLPSGFFGTEDFFVMSADQRTDDGWVVTGMGVGTGNIEVRRVSPGTVPGGVSSAFWAFAQVGGLGSGEATSAVVVEDDGGTASFPEMLDAPSITIWNPSTQELGVDVDPDAEYVRIRLTDKDGYIHDMFVAGTWLGTESGIHDAFSRGKADVDVLTMDIDSGSFEEWASTGETDADAKSTSAVARITQVN